MLGTHPGNTKVHVLNLIKKYDEKRGPRIKKDPLTAGCTLVSLHAGSAKEAIRLKRVLNIINNSQPTSRAPRVFAPQNRHYEEG